MIGEAIATWQLPLALTEVSGLAVAGENTLLMHNDEFGVIYRMDITTGDVAPFLQLGDPPEAADFEGIAVMGGDIFLVDSRGRVYRIEEGLTREGVVDATREGSGLRKTCEVEGLDPAPDGTTLVIACKEMSRKKADSVSLFRYDPASDELTELLAIAFATVGEKIHPSAVVAKQSGFLVLAARDQVLLELGPAGEVIAGTRLAARRHPQAEGLAVLGDRLVIADEGGLVTVYPCLGTTCSDP